MGLLNCKQFKYISFCTYKFFQVFLSWEMWWGPFYVFKTVAGFLWWVNIHDISWCSCALHILHVLQVLKSLYYFTFTLQWFYKIDSIDFSLMAYRWWWGSENFSRFSTVTELGHSEARIRTSVFRFEPRKLYSDASSEHYRFWSKDIAIW